MLTTTRRNKKSNNQRKSSNNRSVRPSFSLPSNPPSFQQKTKVTQRFRFQANTVSTISFSFQDLFSILCAGTTLTVSSTSLFTAIKLRAIYMWSTGGPPSGVQSTLQFEPQFAGALGASPMGAEPVQLTDTSYSAERLAKIVYIPSKGTPFASWQNVVSTSATTGNATFFTTDQNVGDTMDIVLTWILNVGDIALTVNNTASPAAGVVKQFGLPNGTNNWTALPM